MEILGPVEDWAESMKPLIEDGLVDRIQSSFIPAAQHVWEALKTIAEWIFLSKDWIVPLTVAVGTFIARFHMLVGSSIEFLLYWVLHIAVFVVPLVLVWGIGFRPQWKDFFRTWLLAIFWAVFIISINAWLGTNYGFVNHQPEGASLIDWLGPWPVYVVLMAVIAGGLWALMTLPWIQTEPDRVKAAEEQHDIR